MSAGAAAPRIQVADVRASRGAGWIAEASASSARSRSCGSGSALGWLVITFGLLLVPLIGGVIANFLQPVFFASFAIAARRQLAGERVEMGDLFLGFRSNVRALVNLGVVLLLRRDRDLRADGVPRRPGDRRRRATAPTPEQRRRG